MKILDAGMVRVDTGLLTTFDLLLACATICHVMFRDHCCRSLISSGGYGVSYFGMVHCQYYLAVSHSIVNSSQLPVILVIPLIFRRLRQLPFFYTASRPFLYLSLDANEGTSGGESETKAAYYQHR